MRYIEAIPITKHIIENIETTVINAHDKGLVIRTYMNTCCTTIINEVVLAGVFMLMLVRYLKTLSLSLLNVFKYPKNRNSYFLILFLCAQVNIVSAQPLVNEALQIFGNCLSENRSQLEVRDLKDIYRIRGIPSRCCQSLATNLLTDDLTKLVEGIDYNNCRLNLFFVSGGIFDPHNHPLQFGSYIVSGGYTHTIFNKDTNARSTTNLSCIPNLNQICTEHSKIDTKTDIIKKLGTAMLTKSHRQSFTKGDFIAYNNTNIIHRIDTYVPDTLTINFLSDAGDQEIDVFVSHQTPERRVLSKSDTKIPLKKEVSSNIIDKCLMIIKSVLTSEVVKKRLVPSESMNKSQSEKAPDA